MTAIEAGVEDERDTLAERIADQMSEAQVRALRRVVASDPVILRSARSLRRLDLIDDERTVRGLALTPVGERVLAVLDARGKTP